MNHPIPLPNQERRRQNLVRALTARTSTTAIIQGSFGTGRSHLARLVARDLTARRHVVHWVEARHTRGPFSSLASTARAAGNTPPSTFAEACELLGPEADAPPIIVADDAHLLGDEEAEVMSHLAALDRCRLLLTNRTGAVLPRALHDSVVAAAPIRMVLQPLDRSAVADLCAQILGGPATPATIDAVARASTGRPRLVHELLQEARGRDVLARSNTEWELTDNIDPAAALGDIVRGELALLGAERRDLVELIAIAESVDADCLADITDVRHAEFLEEQGWLSSTTPEAGSMEVRLTEPDLAGLVTATLSPLRRRRHITRLAELARTTSTGCSLPQAILLRHESGEAVPIAELRAGTSALIATERLADARILAAEAWTRSQEATDGDQLGQILAQLNRPDDAEAVLAAAEEAARDQDERARILLSRSENLWYAARPAEAADACRQALADLVEPRSRALAAAELASLLGRDGDVTAARATLEVCRTPPDDTFRSAEVIAGLPRTAIDVWGGRPARAIAPGANASAAAEDPTVLPLPPRLYELILLLRADALCQAGSFADACDWLDELHWCAVEFDVPLGIAMTAGIHARLDAERGLLRSARRRLGRGTNALISAGLSQFLPRFDALAAFVEARHGDLQTAQELLDRSNCGGRGPSMTQLALAGRARAWIAHRVGDAESARVSLGETLHLLVDHGALTEAVGVLWDTVVMGAADDLDNGFVASADSIADELDSPLLSARIGVVRSASANHVEALMEQSDTLAGLGAHLDAADAYAMAAIIARGQGDKWLTRSASSKALLAESGCDGARSAVLDAFRPGVEPLTERERLVARLAAEGLASRQIAERLTISVRTVDNLLGRVYRKLEITGRNELALLLTASGGANEPDLQDAGLAH